MLTTQVVEKATARTKYQYYEYGDKCGKLLARQIRKEDSSRCIPSIYDKASDTKIHKHN